MTSRLRRLIQERFREELSERGHAPERVLRNSCTRRHEEGPIVFIFPDDVWYTRVEQEDVPGIVERHLASGGAGRGS